MKLLLKMFSTLGFLFFNSWAFIVVHHPLALRVYFGTTVAVVIVGAVAALTVSDEKKTKKT